MSIKLCFTCNAALTRGTGLLRYRYTCPCGFVWENVRVDNGRRVPYYGRS